MLLLLLACTAPDEIEPTKPGRPSTTPGTEVELARWTFLVYMDGDNDLELYVPTDLDEIEQAGSGDGVNVIVQADRIPGYATGDGDWTGTRRYYMEHHPERGVQTPVLEELGELDMGDPDTLSDFLMWAAENYPAERYALVLWDHGDIWSMAPTDAVTEGADEVAPPSIASDDTSGSVISIAQGELGDALTPFVDQEGPIEVLAFDACLMASWEVAHSLQPYVNWMSASETYVGAEGVSYPEAITLIREDEAATGQELAADLTIRAVEQGLEDTWAAYDMDRVPALSEALDRYAAAVLADPGLFERVVAARDATGSMDPNYPNTYLDLGGFVGRSTAIPGLETAGAEVESAMAEALSTWRTEERWSWATGYTVFAELNAQALTVYTSGAGTSWARDTRWDEMLTAMFEAGHQ